MDEKIGKQLVDGISQICKNKNVECQQCPFYIGICPFGNVRPSTWTEDKQPTIKVNIEQPQEAVQKVPKEVTEEIKSTQPDPKEVWKIQIPMEKGILGKYIFTCSTCGYQKESFFSTPIGVCPECEKKRTEQLIKNLRNTGT